MVVSILNNWSAHHSDHSILFHGEFISTSVTNDPEVVCNWVNLTEAEHRNLPSIVVGLDVEWRPNRFIYQNNPVAVLQLCVANHCLVYQILNSPGVPSALHNFFNNPDYTFVGVNVKSDLNKLQEDYNGLGCNSRYVDLRCLAAKVYESASLRTRGLEFLAFHVLGEEMGKSKNITMSDWDAEFLTQDQIMYASVDAYASYAIGKQLGAPSHHRINIQL